MKVLTMARPGMPEWLAARKGKIGGSDAAAILLGHRPDVKIKGDRKTPLSVWEKLRKELRGEEAPPPDRDEEDGDFEAAGIADYLWWGNVSEPIHVDALARETGWEFEDGPGLIQHDELPWLAGTPDRGVLRPEYPPGVLELKAPAFAWTRAEWAEGAPMPYQVQAAVYMLIWEREWALVSSFTPPSRPIYSVVPLAPQVQDWLLEGLVAFWEQHVLADIPPAPVSDKDYAVARRLFEQETAGKIVQLPTDLIEASYRIDELNGEKTRMQKEITALKTNLVMALEDAQWGVVGPDFVWRYATQGTAVGKKEIVETLIANGMREAAMLVEGIEKTTRVLKKMKGVK